MVLLAYLRKMYKPMRELSKMTDTVSKAGVGWERIQEVLETESPVPTAPRTDSGLPGRTSNSTACPSPTDGQEILKDMHLTIEPGQVVAFVGEPVAEDHLVGLIARFYDPCRTCSIDGTDIRRFHPGSLRDRISFVLQDTLLFPHHPLAEHRLRQTGSPPDGHDPARPNWQT